MDPIEQLEEKIDAAQALYLSKVHVDHEGAAEASKLLKDLKRELSLAIVEDAKPCPSCGSTPHGIRQPNGFSIGCIACQDHRARDSSRRKTVNAWNAGPSGWIRVDTISKKSTLYKLLKKLGLETSVIANSVEEESAN